jgi:predicted nucleic acid-binding protein
MIVVADTSPLNYLIQIECESLLLELYSRVIIPEAVLLELRHTYAPRVVRVWAENLPPWIELKRASASDDPYLHGLDNGEREAILLAEELSADLLLMDERKARAEAARRNMITTGTLGVLARADQRGLIRAFDAYQRLISTTNFHSDPQLERAFLKLLQSS